jgi:hypothetical protein
MFVKSHDVTPTTLTQSEDIMKTYTVFTVAKDGKRIRGTGKTMPEAIRVAEKARKEYETVTKRGGK